MSIRRLSHSCWNRVASLQPSSARADLRREPKWLERAPGRHIGSDRAPAKSQWRVALVSRRVDPDFQAWMQPGERSTRDGFSAISLVKTDSVNGQPGMF